MFDGVVITPLYLLYHDEISIGTTATSGNLTCTVGSNISIWHDVRAMELDSSSSPLQSTSSGSVISHRLSRTGDPIPNYPYNGLWSCIQGDRTAFRYIGIYNRGEGKLTYTSSKYIKMFHLSLSIDGLPEVYNYYYYIIIIINVLSHYFPTGRGAITQDEVTLQSSSFMATPPTFTLYGNTSGGPPVECTWTRDGAVITNNDSYSISIGFNNPVSTSTFNLLSNAFIRSTLTVTGVLPGVYQYSVNNKATPTSVDRNFNIEGI